MARLADLLARKAALDKEIAEAQRAERAAAIEQVRGLMARYGLTLADLAPGRRATRPPLAAARPKATPSAAPAAEAASKPAVSSQPTGRKGRPLGKVAPKYRDPQTGSTWSGRGLRPRWLSAALAAGRSLDEFRLAGTVEPATATDPIPAPSDAGAAAAP
jgi:DNA-binding protein H-NS